MSVMRSNIPVGIVGYGSYVPRFRLPAQEVSDLWTDGNAVLPVREKSVPGLDEDVATMSIEAARNALKRARIMIPGQFNPKDIGAVWVGSESHPYAVKPTSTIVAESIGATPYTQAADWQFACKAGTEAFQASIGFVGSGMAKYALAIGMDAAQGRPGDALEYTAGAGGAAYLLGPISDSFVEIEASVSYVNDTPDFWRRQYEKFPEHAGRFTGEPAYFQHVTSAAQALFEGLGKGARDFDYFVCHQPNTRFPVKAGENLGFTMDQMAAGLLVNDIGNTYAGSCLIGLTAVLDKCKPGDRIMVVSFGSGAGSDAFSLKVTRLPSHNGVLCTHDYVRRRKVIDYAQYTRLKGNYRLT